MYNGKINNWSKKFEAYLTNKNTVRCNQCLWTMKKRKLCIHSINNGLYNIFFFTTFQGLGVQIPKYLEQEVYSFARGLVGSKERSVYCFVATNVQLHKLYQGNKETRIIASEYNVNLGRLGSAVTTSEIANYLDNKYFSSNEGRKYFSII